MDSTLQCNKARRLRLGLSIAMVVVASALVALLLGSGATLASMGLPKTQLSLDTARLDGGIARGENGIQLYSGGGHIEFSSLPGASRTVAVYTSADKEAKTSVMVTLSFVQYDAEGNAVLTQVDEAFINPAGRYNSAVLRMHTQPDDAVQGMRLTFTCPKDSYVVTGIVLNQSGFSFNWQQWLLLLAAGLSILMVRWAGLHRIVYQDDSRRHRLWMTAVVLVCVGCLWWLANLVNGPEPVLLWDYNPNDIASLSYPEHYSHYYHLFDALNHGQLALRTQPDPALVQLANPYDPVARQSIHFMWDTAYYDGSYYTYFGPAPMLLYFPIFWITGKLPAPALAAAVPGILAALCLWGALRQLMRYFGIKPNLLLLSLGLPALVCGSLVPMLVSCADTYVQPYLWAMAGMAGFIWAFFAALGSRSQLKRCLGMLVAGASVVVVAASRPLTALLCLVFALPALLWMLRQKKRGFGGKIADILALGLPVAAGAALLMLYNYNRFGSVFEFGTSYQLTAWDMRTKTFRLSPVWLVQALYFFVCQPLQIQPRFPYLWQGGSNQYYFGNHFFNYSSFGLANLPLYWPLLGLGRTLRRQSAVKKAIYIGVPLVSAVILWTTYTISNILYRYICDVTVPLGLLALLVFFELMACRPALRRPRLSYVLGCGMMLGSIIAGVLMCFTNERNFLLRYATDFYIWVSNILAIR